MEHEKHETLASGHYSFLPAQTIPHPETLAASTDKMPLPLPPPTLPDDLLGEVFMRLPPDEPACLVRASLASKHWLGVLTAPAFRNRYRDFHGAPSMLGFFYCPGSVEEGLFVSTTEFVARIPSEDEDENKGEYEYNYDGWRYSSRKKEEYREYSRSEVWDCRHGRVVLGYRDMDVSPTELVVLDPVTGRSWELNIPKDYDSHGAAVFCAVPGCHHRTCHEGPFQVVVVGMNINKGDSVAYAYCRTDEGSKPCSQSSQPCPGLHLGFDAIVQPMPPVLTQDALYFMLMDDDDNAKRINENSYCQSCGYCNSDEALRSSFDEKSGMEIFRRALAGLHLCLMKSIC
uniref:Uncharacterized protein n=1 Tax=Avena sativa TaxID=4498 RepID=A0ACD6AKQ0_AVESA